MLRGMLAQQKPTNNGYYAVILGQTQLLTITLGWSSNFVGSESGQTPAEYGLQQDSASPHSLPATHRLFIQYFDTGKGEGS
jgi:hypothetical protein